MRRLRSILVSAVVVLALANAMAYFGQPAAPAGFEAEGDEQVLWYRLPTARRVALIQRFESISRQADGAEILGWAREFARASPDEQEHWRDLWEVTMRIIARQAPDQRRDLLRSAPRARAYLLFQMLESQEPETLQRLRRELATPPEPAPP